MSAFADFDETGFLALEPAGKALRRADLRLAFMKMRTAERLTLTFNPEVLEEIGGPRYDIAWNSQKRLLLVKSGPQARFEAHATIRNVSRRIVVPVPAGLHFGEADCEPEFYVDAIGKRLLIEVPAEFGRRLALPAPGPVIALSTLAPVAPKTTVDQEDVVAGNREILRALGVTDHFPKEFRNVRFTPSEACILEALFRGKEISREALLAATHPPENGDDDRDGKIVDVWLSKMRPKLARLDLVVTSLGSGRFGMDAASKGRLRELLREVGARA